MIIAVLATVALVLWAAVWVWYFFDETRYLYRAIRNRIAKHPST